MGEEAFDETVLVANSGTVFIRGGYGREELWLGLSRGRGQDDPDVIVELTPLQRKRLVEALLSMPSPATERCWFCEHIMPLPVDQHGCVDENALVTCAECRGVHVTTEDGDDVPVMALAPVRCGHGIDHDESCRKCSKPKTAGRKQRT